MTRSLITTAVALLSVSCVGPHGGTATRPRAATQPAAARAVLEDDWPGVYASPSEIGGFAGTVLAVEKGPRDGMNYRMYSRSDVSSSDAIRQDVLHGSCLSDGSELYMPYAYGFMHEGEPRLLASITRFTLVEIDGRKVLMRDDALRAFREQNKLYDYGILIKTNDQPDVSLDLAKVEHPSIKVLYSDPTQPWSDPFVHGPNSR
jgi:hypothetical protein